MIPLAIIIVIAAVAYLLYIIYRLLWFGFLAYKTQRDLVEQRTSNGHIDIRIFGDSVASGLGSTSADGGFFGQLDLHFGHLAIDSAAVIGEYMSETARKINQKPYTQRYAVVYSGGKDLLYRRATSYRDSIEKLLRSVSESSDHVVLCIPSNAAKVPLIPRIVRPLMRSRSAAMEELFLELAKSYDNITLINLYRSGGTDLSSFAREYMAQDMMHANDRSYTEWAIKIATAIAQHESK